MTVQFVGHITNLDAHFSGESKERCRQLDTWQDGAVHHLHAARTRKGNTMTPSTLVPGGRYNFRLQPERLVYLGVHRYPGDRRDWYQFALVNNPDSVWSELLDSDVREIIDAARGKP